MESVNSGEVDAGIIYHYYWYRDQKEAGENSDITRSCTSSATRTPAPSSASPAPACSPRATSRTDAQEFVNFLASEEGQQAIADSYALEYPLNPEVSLDPPVKPFSELEPPRIDVSTLNSEPVIELMQEEGLL